MRKAIAIAFLSCAILATSLAQAADVPSTINLQASLQTAAGTPPPNGSYSVKVTLYPSKTSATVLWTETLPAVPLSGGVLDAVLGAGTPLPASLFQANGDVWVGVSVAGEPELPRTAMRTVSYAFRARSSVSADQALDLACSGCVAVGELGFDPATQAELDLHAGNASAHHARYTDAEAVVAMGGKSAANALNHDRYSSGEAVAAMGAKGAGNPLNHDRYTDAEAVAAVGPSLNTINGKTGGTVTGNVTVTGSLSAGGSSVCTAAGNCPDKDTLGTLSCSSGQSPKWNGSAWACATGSGLPTPPTCSGAGKALQWDGSQFACVFVASGGGSQGLGYSLLDSWGATWDGQERSPTTWANAKALCESAGGRLPTATELYRVNYTNGTAEVGSSYTSAWLWGLTEEYANAHIVGRLDNGDISYSADSTVRGFRCIYLPSEPATFTGTNCYGPPGDACWAAKGEGNRYNMDKYDRPATSYNVAVRECAFYKSHLVWERDITEEIQRGLPNGTNEWVWTSDGKGYNGSNFLAGIIRWSGVDSAFDDSYSTYATWGYKATGSEARFRCTGVNYAAGTHPNAIANEWVAPTTQLKSTTADLGSVPLQTAKSACWNGGGHLPMARDLHELISEGLPNGSNNWLWTADQHGYNGSQFLVGINKWSGVDKSFSDYYSTYSTWGYKTGSQPYRCVYYPVDETYTGPSSCSGGCFSSTKGGGKVKMWMDNTDRAAARFHQAIRACNDLGGHLANDRDFTEMIREGLPNGSNNWIWSSDQEMYNGTNFLTAIIKWSGVDVNFSDQYSTYSTWAYKVNSASYQYPYRCVWTNELR